MAGSIGTGSSLLSSAIQGIDASAGREFKRSEAEAELKAQAVKSAVNTAGSALGLAGIAAVQMKKSGILNDIF